MEAAIRFLVAHGYLVVFAAVLIDQAGLPLPSLPVLLAAGALAREGSLSFPIVGALAIAASIIVHFGWYELGRWRGAGILRFICRLSLEPDVCVRKTENLFGVQGRKGLILAQFIPGLDVVAQPLAAISGMPRFEFLAMSAAAAALWAGALIAIGFALGPQLRSVADVGLQMGSWLAAFLIGAFLLYIAWKVFDRQRLLRRLRVARISPRELKDLIDAGAELAVIDLRHPIEFDEDPRTIPGAMRISAEELEQRHSKIPRDRDVIVYCT